MFLFNKFAKKYLIYKYLAQQKNNQKSMSSPGQHKFTQQSYMNQRIEVPETGYEHQQAHQNTSLLKVKEELLNTSQIRMNTQNKIFWLQTFGMFIFIYASTCSKMNTGVDLAFFVGILMAIPIIAKQTGANLNPAVSLSMITKNDPSSTYTLMWIYFKAQVIGAIISMIFAMVLNDIYRTPLYPSLFTTGEIVRMIVSQAVGVFALIFFVLYATGPYSFIQNNGAKFFYISVFVYIGRKFAVASGNQINLALTISQAFVGIPTCDYQGFKYIWIWLIGDAIGVIVASQFYNRLLEPTVGFLKKRQKARQQYRKAQESEFELKNLGNKA